MSTRRAKPTPPTDLLIDHNDQPVLRESLKEFGSSVRVVKEWDEHHFDGQDVIRIGLDVLNSDGTKIFLGYLLAKNVSFTIVKGTLVIKVKNVSTLLKYMKKIFLD